MLLGKLSVTPAFPSTAALALLLALGALGPAPLARAEPLLGHLTQAAPPKPSLTPSPAGTPAAPTPSDEPAYDRKLLSKAIAAVDLEFTAEGRKFTAQNKAEARARFEADKARWNADQERRNDPYRDDDGDRKTNRDNEFDKRFSGNMGPPAPKWKDYERRVQTWDDKMKAEVAAERLKSPASGKKGGTPLIAATHPLSGKEIGEFIARKRDKITDGRIRDLLGRIEKRYLEYKEAADAEAAESDVGSAADGPAHK